MLYVVACRSPEPEVRMSSSSDSESEESSASSSGSGSDSESSGSDGEEESVADPPKEEPKEKVSAVETSNPSLEQTSEVGGWVDDNMGS